MIAQVRTERRHGRTTRHRWTPRCSVALYASILAFLVLARSVPAQTVNGCPETATSLVTTTPDPGITWSAERYADIRAELRTTRFNLIALGDSLIHGWPQALLESVVGGSALNVGFGGDKTQNVLWRLQDLDWSAQSPKAVVLLVGTGNIGHPACAIAAGLAAVIGRIRTVFPKAKLLVVSLLPRGINMREFDDKIVSVNRHLATVREAWGYTLVDVHDGFLCEHSTPCRLFRPDNLHLSQPGYEQLTEAIRATLPR